MQFCRLRSWWISWTKRRGYDDYMHWLVCQLEGVEHAKEGDKLLMDESRKGRLEMHYHTRFRYGEYNIITMFDEFALQLEERLKVVNKLGLKSFPIFVESIKVTGGMYVVTYTPGTKERDLDYYGKPTTIARLKVSQDLKRLMEEGYYITRFETYLNSYGDIIIPTFILFRVGMYPDELRDSLKDYTLFDYDEWIPKVRACYDGEVLWG